MDIIQIIIPALISSIISFLFGVIFGEPVKHYYKKLFDSKDTEISNKNIFKKLNKQMPKLLHEMRLDLQNNPYNREFIIMSNKNVYIGKSIVYYFEDHDDLDGKIQILENYNLIQDITNNNVGRFKISEQFVEMLNKYLL